MQVLPVALLLASILDEAGKPDRPVWVRALDAAAIQDQNIMVVAVTQPITRG